METKNGVPYIVKLVPAWKWPIKCPEPMAAKKVTVHNTDNEMDAMSEINYMISNNNETSYHVAIDEDQAVQGLAFNRNGWHSGDGYNGYGNRNTIGFEVGRNYDRKRSTTNLLTPLKQMYSKAEENAIKVIPQIMIEQGIVASYDTVKSHHDWSGKWCPSKILNEGRWRAVQTAIIAEYIRLVNGNVSGSTHKPVEKPRPSVPQVSGIVSVEKEKGSFKANDAILVRDRPSIGGKHIATYQAGEVLKEYIRIHKGNGYLWLEYERKGTPSRGFIPVRTYHNGVYGELWGEVRDVGGFDRKEKTYIHLKEYVPSWKVYPLGVAPIASNSNRALSPSLFKGGLTYEVKGYEDNGGSAIIDTQDYGRVKIWIDGDARIYKDY